VVIFKRYWGFFALIAALVCWAALVAGKVTSSITAAILILSLAAIEYFSFQAPLLWCGAQIRSGDFCRNNCSGLLLGCHLRQHKWQKLQTMFQPKKWPELNRVLWTGAKQIWASVSAVVALVSTVLALIALLR
jgi:preprotein translocase subunit SecE